MKVREFPVHCPHHLQHMKHESGISQSSNLNKIAEFFVKQYSAYSYDKNDCL